MSVDRFFISRIGLTGAQEVITLEVRSLGRDPLNTKPQPYTSTINMTNTHPIAAPIANYFMLKKITSKLTTTLYRLPGTRAASQVGNVNDGMFYVYTHCFDTNELRQPLQTQDITGPATARLAPCPAEEQMVFPHHSTPFRDVSTTR